jgi:hypothetical protein
MTEDIATVLITQDQKIIAQVRLTSRVVDCLVRVDRLAKLRVVESPQN